MPEPSRKKDAPEPISPAPQPLLPLHLAPFSGGAPEPDDWFLSATNEFPYTCVLYDRELRIRLINPAGIAKSGLTIDQVLGHRDDELFPPDVTETYLPHLHRCLKTRAPQHFESTHTPATGTSTVAVSYIPLLDGGDHVHQILALTHDLTAQRRTEQALRESERRYRELVENANSAIVRWRCDGTLTFFNEYAQTLFGYRAEDVIGNHVGLLLPNHESTGADLTGLVDDIVAHPQRYTQFINENVCRDGRRVWMAWTNRPLFDPEGKVAEILAVGTDITEQHRVQERLRREHRESTLANCILQVFMEETGDDIFDRALATLLAATGSRHGVFGYIAEEGHLVCPSLSKMLADCEVAGKCIEYPPEKWKGLWARALHEQRSFYTNEPPPVPRGHVAIDNNLATPILFRGKVIGLFNQANKEGGYSAADRDLADAIAARVAPVLYAWMQQQLREQERAAATEALRQSEARFRLLSHTASQLLSTDEPQALVEDLCHRVMAHLDCQVFFNFLLDEQTQRLRLNACGGIDRNQADRIKWLDLGVAVCGLVARDGCRVIVEDIRNTPDPRTELIRSYGIQAYCCHPLVIQGQTIGTLSFGARNRAHFTSEEIELMHTVADQVATAKFRVRTERALRQANAELDRHVQARTIELSETVDLLRAEAAQRQAVEDALRLRSEQLRELASELTLAEQRERRRLAELLHDNLQQLLVGTMFRLGRLAGKAAPELHDAFEEVQDLLDESIQCSRSLTAELSPPILHQAGLVPALRWLAGWMQQQHALQLDVQLCEDAAPASQDIQVLLFQSVRELLFNAVKHAGVDRARVCLRRDGERFELIVADEGAGFDPDYVAANEGRVGGFGLFSIRERLDLLGGELEIDSAPGRGSRFVMRGPLVHATGSPVAMATTPQALTHTAVAAAAPTRDPAARPIRVLLADDHAVVRDGLARLLDHEPDIEVVAQADDGQAALDLARRLQPDVVTMDIRMPGMNGIETTRALVAELPQVRVIGLSMFEEEETARRMRQAGAVAFLSKSGPTDTLLATIRKYGQS